MLTEGRLRVQIRKQMLHGDASFGLDDGIIEASFSFVDGSSWPCNVSQKRLSDMEDAKESTGSLAFSGIAL